MLVTVYQNGNILLKGVPENVREKIEEMITERLGFCPMLEQSTDDGEFEVYLHTESFEDLTEEEIEQITALGITEFREESTEAVKRFLNLDFQLEEPAAAAPEPELPVFSVEKMKKLMETDKLIEWVYNDLSVKLTDSEEKVLELIFNGYVLDAPEMHEAYRQC